MAITLREYLGSNDLELQRDFWVRATRELPWCWKPTNSPNLYAKGEQFDPRSRCFAFDGDRLVGYMSFTGQGGFVSLGYPWVLPEYEGKLQEELYSAVYGFAASPEYGGKTFAQRFREQWSPQISFFLRHGFTEQRSEAIYAVDLRSASSAPVFDAATSVQRGKSTQTLSNGRFHLEVQPEFEWEEFRELAAIRLPQEQVSMFQSYFQTVDFDFTVKALEGDRSAAYLGFAIRLDTGFAELVAVALDRSATDSIGPCLMLAIHELQARNALFLGTKPVPVEGVSEIIEKLGFKRVSTELLLSKTI